MSITIYGSIGSRASRCLWVAQELGVAYEWKSVSTLDGSNRTPEYLRINPSGRIPALTDGDVVMTESLAINHYLAQTYGGGSLWPTSRALQAQVLQWSFWSATEIEYYIGAIFRELILTPAPRRERSLIDKLVAAMLPQLDTLESALTNQEYILGTFTLADINVVVQLFTIVDRFALDLAHLPSVLAWTARCKARPARTAIEALAATANGPRPGVE